MPKSVVAALQIGALPEGKAATLEQILSYETAIIEAGAQLVVMPEALLGATPRAKASAPSWGIACRRGARPSPAISPMPSMSPGWKPKPWPGCRRVPGPT